MIADEWTPSDTWLVILERDGTAVHAMASEEGNVDAKVTEYRHSGRDSIVRVTLAEGTEYHVVASQVTGWWTCTPEHRRRSLLRDQHATEASKALRADLGLPWEED